MFKPVFFSIVMLLLPFYSAFATFNEEIHYMGKVVFPISGTLQSSDGSCRWEVSGGVTLVLSFSKSTSMAGFILRRNDLPVVEDNNTAQQLTDCLPNQTTQSFKIPLNVNPSERSFAAVDARGVSRIIGKTENLQVSGQFEHAYQNPVTGHSERWSGTFSTELKEIPGEMINVDQIKGSVISSIPMGIANVQDSVPDACTIVTAENSSATLHEAFGSRVNIRAKTIVTRLPVKQALDKEIRRYMLINGSLESDVSIQNRNFEVMTPIARVRPDNRLFNANGIEGINAIGGGNFRTEVENTQFSAEYQASEDGGSLTVSVTSGTVVVTDNQNNTTVVTAGEEQSFSETTNRTSWVQPADGGFFYGGIENLLAWTAYPGAYQYFLEYNFPIPEFANENPKGPEFETQSILVTPDLFSLWENLVIFPIILPELEEAPIEVRIYPQDENGKILSSSVSSDRATLLYK